jgi:hypothetical protein
MPRHVICEALEWVTETKHGTIFRGNGGLTAQQLIHSIDGKCKKFPNGNMISWSQLQNYKCLNSAVSSTRGIAVH